VILTENDFLLSGQLQSDAFEITEGPGADWVKAGLAELSAMPNICVMPYTTLFSGYDGSTYGAIEHISGHLVHPSNHPPRQRLWRIVTRRTVDASGAVK
jgi:sarcosine oxidase subunit alpha